MLPLLMSNLAILITLAIHNNLELCLNNDKKKKKTPNNSDSQCEIT